MARIAKKAAIKLYDVGPTGLAQAVYFAEDGSETVLLEMETLVALKKTIYDYKRDNNLMQVRVEVLHDQAYEKNSPHIGEAKKKKRIPVNKRFAMAGEIIEMVLKDYIHSVVLCGQGGCGKSYTVLDILHKQGYEPKARPGGKFYRHLRGSISPMELYKFLYDHRKDVIVFDDADSVFQTESSCNILKAILDTTGPRVVAWYSGALDDEVPSEYCFEGKVIFISNRVMERIPDPIQSRAMLLDLSFTKEELVHRMRELAPIMCPYLSEDQRSSLLDHIEEHVHMFKNVSLRTLSKAGKIVEANVTDWRDTVLFAS